MVADTGFDAPPNVTAGVVDGVALPAPNENLGAGVELGAVADAPKREAPLGVGLAAGVDWPKNPDEAGAALPNGVAAPKAEDAAGIEVGAAAVDDSAKRLAPLLEPPPNGVDPPREKSPVPAAALDAAVDEPKRPATLAPDPEGVAEPKLRVPLFDAPPKGVTAPNPPAALLGLPPNGVGAPNAEAALLA